MKAAGVLVAVLGLAGVAWYFAAPSRPSPEPYRRHTGTPAPDAEAKPVPDAAKPPPKVPSPHVGHWISALAVDGATLYSADNAGNIARWETATGTLQKSWAAHKGSVRRLIPSVTGVASMGRDGYARTWSREGAALSEVRLPSHYLNDGAPIPDGFLLVGSGGAVARVTGKGVAWNFKRHAGDALAGVVAPGAAQIATGGFDGDIAISDGAGAELRRWKADKGWVTALAWRGDTLISGGVSGWLRRWDPATGTLHDETRVHTRSILALAMTPSHTLTASEDASAKIFAADYTTLHVLKVNDMPVEAAALDGRHAYTGTRDGLVRVWDLETGAELRTF